MGGRLASLQKVVTPDHGMLVPMPPPNLWGVLRAK